MTRNSKLLLVVLISTAHLAISLVAIAWLFGCLEQNYRQQISSQVSQANHATIAQAVAHVESMNLGTLSYKSDDWCRLQEFVEDTGRSDDAFLSVIDLTNGMILCHPTLTRDGRLHGTSWDDYVINSSEGSFLDQITDSIFQENSGVLMAGESSLYWAHGQSIPDLGICVVSHRKINESNLNLLAMLKGFSFAGVLAVGLFVTVMNVFVTKRIAANDIRIQSKLERLVDERTDELELTKNGIVFGLAKLAESRDNDTGQHLDRIRKYVTILATDLQATYDEIDSEFIKNLAVASSLHDIGKVGIPDSILLKPGRLTTLERTIMQKHTVIGGECIEAIGRKLGDNDFLEIAREVAFWHHEHWDGGGYPHKLSEDAIPISARIVAVADVYDALTSRRPYKRAMSHTESRAIVLSGSGQMFDPEVVAAFLRHESEFQQISKRFQNHEHPELEESPVEPSIPTANVEV